MQKRAAFAEGEVRLARWDTLVARQAKLAKNWTDEEVEADVTASVEEVRAARWAREQGEAR
jgi:hypothetical protein